MRKLYLLIGLILSANSLAQNLGTQVGVGLLKSMENSISGSKLVPSFSISAQYQLGNDTSGIGYDYTFRPSVNFGFYGYGWEEPNPGSARVYDVKIVLENSFEYDRYRLFFGGGVNRVFSAINNENVSAVFELPYGAYFMWGLGYQINKNISVDIKDHMHFVGWRSNGAKTSLDVYLIGGFEIVGSWWF